MCYASRSHSHTLEAGGTRHTFPLPIMYMYGDFSTSSPSVKTTSPRWKTTASSEDIIFSKLCDTPEHRTNACSRTAVGNCRLVGSGLEGAGVGASIGLAMLTFEPPDKIVPPPITRFRHRHSPCQGMWRFQYRFRGCGVSRDLRKFTPPLCQRSERALQVVERGCYFP